MHTYAVTCEIGLGHDLDHLSKVLTGLFELAADDRIELHLAAPPAEEAGQSRTCVAGLHVQAATGGPVVHIAVDVYDRSDTFGTGLLESCTTYFKRSFHRPDVERLPPALQSKVAPFGINHACRTSRGESRLQESAHLAAYLNRYRQLLAFEEYEQGPSAAVEQSILFQTRAWAPESTSDDVENLNESRASIIRALRSAFPGRFQGGFIPNSFAQQRYPDLLSKHPDDPSQYIRFSKRHLIGISSHGLHHSLPFKVSEYMAASLAIVSEPLRTELPAPFMDRKHFLEFNTPDECVEKCDRLLSDPDLAAELRDASRQYYQSEARPAQHAAKLLERGAANPGCSRLLGGPSS